MTRRTLLAFLPTAVVATAFTGTDALAAETGEWRVFEAATGRALAWRDLPDLLAKANAVFVGEQHDDPETHRVEAALFEAVHKLVGDRLTLAMEMFERDQQSGLSDYLAGKTEEATFSKFVKLWPNYPTDYRPLVEYAKARHIPVVASNAPARLVRAVGREGLPALAKLPDADKPLVASYVNAPDGDEYYKRFAAVMAQGHGESKPMEPAQVRRIYEAQCTRDDTMAESVARLLDAGRTVFHVNGSFHSDAGLGTVARLRWRRPLGTRAVVVKVIATNEKPYSAALNSEADYLVFVPARRPADRKTS